MTGTNAIWGIIIIRAARYPRTKRHVDNRLSLPTLARNIVDSPLVSLEDNRGRRLLSKENLDVNQVHLLSNAVRSATDSTGDVRTVPKSIVKCTTRGIVATDSAAAKVGVVDVDAAINDISVAAATSRRIVVVGIGAWGGA